ncbi:unnamed protein product [Toxocara canis]|uniref:TauD domain-containing protein n=1 Tax=Toxocara canis TaxID=6265 RepID=A0A183U8D7_TOXCA|nr:unnamed protein product [Toxocara canis]
MQKVTLFIKVFHCLRPANKGGDTILVDGFAVADKLRRQNPGYYELLASTPVEHHYIEGGDCPSNAKIYSRSVDQPVIVLDRQANIKQIRFNPYDRAPFAIHSTKDIVFFYKVFLFEILFFVVNIMRRSRKICSDCLKTCRLYFNANLLHRIT